MTHDHPSVPRRFYLQRNTDVTGASGTGRVADGVLWPDGTATVHWIGEDNSDAFWPTGIAGITRRSCHDGNTVIVWLDFESTEIENDLPCLHCIDGHGSPDRCTWGVRVGPDRDGGGRPVHLLVQPTNGAHVSTEDAAWLQGVIDRDRI
ncbi:hypothetical protein [Streptomyces nymphaeiformis]|uniref:Uncharacterized protein n=1 Tax=Streptomyces nymphaeiformis TaxID=2663842 RepID=A0A7W7XE64_9ACTN|nr:hypothetical protein [Streptomyces nymphaeiformis]MBB4984980.1 hypothetical protein [Streptomyces nymphaeiformis]